MANPVMEEREEPKKISFNTGDVLEGVLVGIQMAKVGDKPAVRYTLKEDDGEFVFFFGTHQLNTKLRRSDRGHFVSIRCEGEDTMVSRNGNNMKVFKVLVSKEPVIDGELFITDEDIPF